MKRINDKIFLNVEGEIVFAQVHFWFFVCNIVALNSSDFVSILSKYLSITSIQIMLYTANLMNFFKMKFNCTGYKMSFVIF
jgi:hypothetical protein